MDGNGFLRTGMGLFMQQSKDELIMAGDSVSKVKQHLAHPKSLHIRRNDLAELIPYSASFLLAGREMVGF